jgi:hypothetical protein
VGGTNPVHWLKEGARASPGSEPTLVLVLPCVAAIWGGGGSEKESEIEWTLCVCCVWT